MVRRNADIEYGAVSTVGGVSKGVLVSEADGAPNFAIRWPALDPSASVPEHTNEVEHEQYVLSGHYAVGIGDKKYEVEAGDSLLIPAGVVHWYRNESDAEGAFLCTAPDDDDTVGLTTDADV